MTTPRYSSRFDPRLWVHVERILGFVPRRVALGGCRTSEEMINALGVNGAYDALRAYLAALQEYYSDTVFQALRAAAREPQTDPERPRFGAEPFDDALWARMFDASWRESSHRA